VTAPTPDIIARVSALLHETPRAWQAVTGGYTPAARWLAHLNDKAVFVKHATTPLTQKMLRRELLSYETISGDFMPSALAWQDHEDEPLLIIEDLSAAHWPPPWTPTHIDAVRAMLDRLHAQTAPSELPPCALTPSWPKVAADPAPFLSLGIVSAAWLDAALPAILAAEAACQIEGDALCHFDIRSDNLCFRPDGRAVLIDWAEACRGNPALDLGAWLPSLAREGGPSPDEILPNRPDVAAMICGYFAARAGLPIIPDAPRVRDIQAKQLSTALPWMIRALGLPAP
jgi:hypothetical protein